MAYDLKEKLAALKRWARRAVPPSCRDDFTQAVALAWLEGKRLNAAYQHLWIDWVRRQARLQHPTDVDPDELPTPHRAARYSLLHVPHSGRERAFAILQILGYPLREIAFIFGISESIVSRTLKENKKGSL